MGLLGPHRRRSTKAMRFRPLLLLSLLLGALLPALAQDVVRFAVIGDSGTGEPPQHAVAHRMEEVYKERGFDFVLMLGDNIYENGETQHFDSKFKKVYKKLMDDGVRFHASLGNHDRRNSKGIDQVNDDAFGYVGRKAEYQLIEGHRGDGGSLVRFMALNSAAWIDGLKNASLRQDLRTRRDRLDRWLETSGLYDWNILYMHHPPYSYVRRFLFIKLGHGSATDLRRELEPKITGKVDVVFAGHDHFYQRIHPQEGVHYFVSGAAAKLRPGVDKNHPNVRFATEQLHFLYVWLTREALNYEVIGTDGQVLDSDVIPRRN